MFMFVLIMLLFAGVSKASDWGYSGSNRPAVWMDLYPDSECNGASQSPIDIDITDTVYNESFVNELVYRAEHPNFTMLNNGHSLQVNTEGNIHVFGAGSELWNYATVQFHFHWGSTNDQGSEHTIDGRAFPLEMHVVNYDEMAYRSVNEAVNKPMGLAVVSVLFELSTTDNPGLQPLVSLLQNVIGVGNEYAVPESVLSDLMSDAGNQYYRYNGSLTTPMCYESVVWTVLAKKQSISEPQLNEFRQMLSEHGDLVDNFRPVQPLNGRDVYRNFDWE